MHLQHDLESRSSSIKFYTDDAGSGVQLLQYAEVPGPDDLQHHQERKAKKDLCMGSLSLRDAQV